MIHYYRVFIKIVVQGEKNVPNLPINIKDFKSSLTQQTKLSS